VTRLGWFLVAGTGLLLAAGVGLDTTAPVDDGAPRADFVPSARPQPAATPAPPGAEPVHADDTDAAVATILERPLFSRDRRPASAAAVAIQVDAPLPRLTGIVIGPEGARAFFAPTDGGRAKIVAVGGSLGPYRVTSIDATGVRIEGVGEPRTLVLAFGPQAVPTDAPLPTAEGGGAPNGLPPQQYNLNARGRPLLPGRGLRPLGQYPGLPSLGAPPSPLQRPGENGLPEPPQGGQIPSPGTIPVPGTGRNADTTAG